MTALRIVKYGEKILKQPTEKVDFSLIAPAELTKIIDDLLETMYLNSGIGLAANQVGWRWRIMVIDLKPDGHKKQLVLINPVIKQCLGKKEVMGEGCLSFPGIQIPVKRFSTIRVQATGPQAQPLEFIAEGLFARVIQHEYDHLLGKVFIDRLPFFKKLAVISEIRRRQKQGQW